MKTMQVLKMKNLHRCLKFKHIVCVTISLVSLSVFATEDVNYVSRKPAAVEEEVLTIPLNEDSFFTNDNMFAEDDAGVMKDMKESLNGWDKTEEYARVWDLKSTGLYNTPTTTEKGKYITKKLLRYADKRLSGEMKKAGEGSTLHSMSKVERNLRPNAAMNISKDYALKFKARALQGKAIVEFKNPYIECNATVSANGKAKLISKKEFQSLGLTSGAEYSVNDSQFLAYVDQQLTANVKARISNTTGNDAESRVEMTASFPFNL